MKRFQVIWERNENLRLSFVFKWEKNVSNALMNLNKRKS